MIYLTEEIVKNEVYKGYTIVVRRLGYKNVPDSLRFCLFDYFCGYIEVPRNHKYYFKSYYEIEDEINVHGGLTFSGYIEDYKGIKSAYYIGFDCGHYGDRPDLQDEEYTLKECKKVVEQLKGV